MSLKDSIFQKQDIPREVVHIPEWDCDVEVRGMSGFERANLMQQLSDGGGRMDFTILYPEVIIACTFDPQTGEQVFGPQDKDGINSKSGAAIERIAQVGLRLSGMTSDSVDVAGKGSSTTLSDASITN